MKKSLVIVESPAKAKTIEKFLGGKFKVFASMGHLRDLPKSQFGVDVENEFAPKYINIRGKGDTIKQLKDLSKNAPKIYLATDPDREGEAIAWHLSHLLGIEPHTACRIEFNEITKGAVQHAIMHPRPIDIDKVDAQQARRILDRIVGYKLSPLLWRKVKKGLSAGRVQSVALRLLCDREREVEGFKSEEYWTITTLLRSAPGKSSFEAEVLSYKQKKLEITSGTAAVKIEKELKKYDYQVADIKQRERRRNPLPPFTTSTLQQEAAKKLGFTARKTMMVAQQLYEGIELGNQGPVGLITYMRTDSTRVSETAQVEVRQYIVEKHGNAYLPETPPIYVTKKSQDAHEAIRPTTILLIPADVEKYLSRDQFRLYSLIWSRFVASQMTSAVYDTVSADISAGDYNLRASGSVVKFDGFMCVYVETSDEKSSADGFKTAKLPALEKAQKLILEEVQPNQHFTQPPPRYTEASLVKIMEERGIGRPSTYAPIIETLLERGYATKLEKRFHPTELGYLVLDLLQKYFPDIINIEFTAAMETHLDSVADGEMHRNHILKDFYDPFAKDLGKAEEEIGHVELPVEESDTPCDVCGKMMVIKQGRFGRFLACPGFPACRNTKPIVKELGINCPLCNGQIIQRRTKKGRNFFGCSEYPTCNFVSWDTPTNEKCKECGSLMGKHQFKNGGIQLRCSNEQCVTRQKTEGTDRPSSRKRSKSVETIN